MKRPSRRSIAAISENIGELVSTLYEAYLHQMLMDGKDNPEERAAVATAHDVNRHLAEIQHKRDVPIPIPNN